MNVKVCPVCDSQDVSPDLLYKFEQTAGLCRYKCNHCGYSGPMTVMKKNEANKLKVKKIKKK
jgi:formate dehydrogenase maturation protein FdhE